LSCNINGIASNKALVRSLLRISTIARIASSYKYNSNPKSKIIVLAIVQISPIDLLAILF